MRNNSDLEHDTCQTSLRPQPPTLSLSLLSCFYTSVFLTTSLSLVLLKRTFAHITLTFISLYVLYCISVSLHLSDTSNLSLSCSLYSQLATLQPECLYFSIFLTFLCLLLVSQFITLSTFYEFSIWCIGCSRLSLSVPRFTSLESLHITLQLFMSLSLSLSRTLAFLAKSSRK